MPRYPFLFNHFARIIFGAILAAMVMTSCQTNYSDDLKEVLAGLDGPVDYSSEIKPILSDRCFACHGPDDAKREAGLRLDLPAAAFGELPDNPGKRAIKAGSPNQSQMVLRILSEDQEMIMPPPESNLSLNTHEKALLIKWIDQGAEYKPHWAFTPPQTPPLPKVNDEDWSDNPIDLFVLEALDMRGMKPSPPATKEILLRRVAFDLTGIPPTVDQIESFLADSSPQAFERVVEEMLSNPTYGERMAVDWLDLARYADTHGYTVDRYRDMSPWRDWVIKALNENMPYDQFVTWQLAGDLLPNPTREQIIATGFNRNHQQNMEGGIVDEEFRVEYVADRTNTLGTAFLGLTLGCARCHDHKYDPVSQEEYYQLFSFFNQINEAGQIDFSNAMPVPTLLLTDEKVDSIVDYLDQKMDGLENAMAASAENERFESWMTRERHKIAAKKLPAGLIAHFPLDRHTNNRLVPGRAGVMRQQFISEDIPAKYQNGRKGAGLRLDGDAWLDLGDVGIFDRHDAFSVALWINLPETLSDGVIFHKGDGAALYNFRGYHLALKDDRFELLLARTTPNNAIVKYVDHVPKNEWIQIVFAYDGLGKAEGLQLYINGRKQTGKTKVDNLYKSILFNRKKEPGLQLGARWRGIGVKGATIDDVMVFNRALTEMEAIQLYDPLHFSSLCRTAVNGQSASIDKDLWKAYYTATQNQEWRAQQEELRRWLVKKAEVLDTVPELMVMEEMAERRPTFVLDRGQYNVYKHEVKPDVPASLSTMKANLPRNRLGLAKWLFDPTHPLTARVAVNRYWQLLMGHGIVQTAEDFGNQGSLPTHPKLLDWLAHYFQSSGWDVKALLKKIVLSRTYQQSSIASADRLVQDPDNEWYARGPSERLAAEMLRDQALFASGLLNEQIGGVSVYPYQPENLWKVNGGKYLAPTREQVYRRSLYTIWKRSVPHPTQSTFDAPDRNECQPRRQKTTTPLQALILMNDPTFIEAARVLGAQISKDKDKGLSLAFVQLTGRKPTSEEVTLLNELQSLEVKKFRAAPEKMEGWLSTGLTKVESKEKVLLAANTVVASTMMNMDASLIKR